MRIGCVPPFDAPSSSMTDSRTDKHEDIRRDWNAAAYHRLSEPQFAWGLKVLDRLALLGTERVLDAGCGSGRLTREVRARVPHGLVVGCDFSENMIRAAAKTLGRSMSGALVRGDLSEMPFNAAFDAVYSTATFHWIRGHDRLFTELRRTLRGGGRLEAQCGGGSNLATIHARADALAAEPIYRAYFVGWRDPWHFATPDDTEGRLRRAGFGIAHCWLEHAPTRFVDADAFRAFLRTVVLRPYLARIPKPEVQTNFLETIVEQAASDDPPFTLDYWRLNISAKLE